MSSKEETKEITQRNNIFIAVERGDLAATQNCLEEEGANNANYFSKENGKSVLHLAVKLGHIDIVRLLLGVNGIQINQRDIKGNTAFHLAAENGHQEIFKLLSERRIMSDINITNNIGRTALMHASEKGHTDNIVNMLLALPNIDINMKDKDGETALMFASWNGHTDIVKALLAVPDVDVNMKNRYDYTALMLATETGHTDTVNILLSVPNIDINMKNMDGRTALMIACEKGHTNTVKLLLAVHDIIHDINMKNMSGITALTFACEYGHTDIVNLLLAVPGIDVNLGDNRSGETALMYASENDHTDIVNILLTVPGIHDIDMKNKYGMTALMFASENGHADIVNILLAVPGIDINIQDNDGRTALMHASGYKHEDTVLLGGVPRILNFSTQKIGRTALMIANKTDHTKTINILLAVPRIDINMKDKYGKTALMFASEKGHTDIVKALLTVTDIDINMKDVNGDSAFDNAVKNKKYDCLMHYSTRLMVEIGDVSLQNESNKQVSCPMLSRLLDTHSLPATVCLTMIKDMVRTLPIPAIHKAVYSKDENDRTLLHITHKEVREYLWKQLYFLGRYDLHASDRPVHCSATSVVMKAIDYGLMEDYEKLFYENADVFHDQASYIQEGPNFKKILQSSLFEKFHKPSAFCNDGRKQGSIDIEESVKAELTSLCQKNGGMLSLAQWLTFCESHLGSTRSVVIKFMQSKDQYSREILLRQDPSTEEVQKKMMLEPYVVKILDHFAFDNEINADANIVNNMIQNEEERKKLVDINLINGRKLNEYSYGIVMPEADRSLDSIFRSERPNLLHIKSMMHDVGEALQHCHNKGIIHGDLKMLNVVRVEGKMRLIDLDAAAIICDPSKSDVQHKRSYGAKFSSGVLPPEMFYQLKEEDNVEGDVVGDEEIEFNEYWKHIQETQPELWQKIKPRQYVKGGHNREIFNYVVKSFRSDSSDEEMTNLPYHNSIVKANVGIDIWAFGLLLYNLCAGQPLLPVNRDDDLADAESMMKAASWSDRELERKIEAMHVVDETNVDSLKELLKKILKVNPADRRDSMKDILDDPFFHCGESSTLQSIKQAVEKTQNMVEKIDQTMNVVKTKFLQFQNMSKTSLMQFKRTERVLRNAIFEATDVTVPTSFIIVNHKLPFVGKGRLIKDEEKVGEEGKGEGEVIVEDGSWLVRLTSLMTMAAEVSLPLLEKVEGTVGEMMDWIEDPKKALTDAVKELCTNQTLYFYLLDERTMQPVVLSEEEDRRRSGEECAYPIELKSPTEFLLRVLPLLKVSYRAIAVANGLLGVPRALGYPVPQLPEEMMEQTKKAIDNLNKGYQVLDEIVNPDNKQKEKVRGGALRQLKKFYDEEMKFHDFAGLIRVGLPTGEACWTTNTGYQAMLQEAEEEEKMFEVKLQINEMWEETAKSGGDIGSEQDERKGQYMPENSRVGETSAMNLQSNNVVKEVQMVGGDGGEDQQNEIIRGNLQEELDNEQEGDVSGKKKEEEGTEILHGNACICSVGGCVIV